MKTDKEIRQMFKDMDLETEEKRSQFAFSFSYAAEKDYKSVPFFHADTKTEDLKEE